MTLYEKMKDVKWIYDEYGKVFSWHNGHICARPDWWVSNRIEAEKDNLWPKEILDNMEKMVKTNYNQCHFYGPPPKE